jgi:hypothetical protein
MKTTRVIKTFLLSLSISLFFFLASSGSRADEQVQPKEPIVSAMNITRILNPDHETATGGENRPEGAAARKFSVALNGDVNAYMDFGRPRFETLGPNDPQAPYRAIVGFHIPLK